MSDWLCSLLALQDLDLKAAKLEEQLAEIPQKAAEVKEFYLAEDHAAADAKKTVQEYELAVRKIESEITALKDEKKNLLTKSSLIRNNDEYRAAMLQIEMCDHAVNEKETAVLEKMDLLDEAKRLMAEKTTSLQEAKQRALGIIDDLRTRQQNCKQALAELAARRPALVQGIDAPLLSLYNRLRQARNQSNTRPCVVSVELNNEEENTTCSCSRCHIKLPAQTLADVRRGILRHGIPPTCSSCAAILYLE